MDTTTRAGTPLRQRMLEDMRMRKFEPKTQAGYLRAVRKLTKFLGRSPDTASAEDLRSFQMHLVDEGASPITGTDVRAAPRLQLRVPTRGELVAVVVDSPQNAWTRSSTMRTSMRPRTVWRFEAPADETSADAEVPSNT